ncbi:hypothetical protein LINPERPRIM_LOCUS27046 [Linum perenne]
MTTFAGLPQYVVLKDKFVGKYLHYLYNSDEFGDYYKCVGAKRDLDPVNPFVKFEVVPSTVNPAHVHLRCSYPDKFIEMVVKNGVTWLSATADYPDEDLTTATSTIFEPIVKDDAVGFVHVQSGSHVELFFNEEYSDYINNVACVFKNDGAVINRFEFSPWVPYAEA